MDAKSIVPTGWHFVSHFCEPDGMTRISPLDRKNHSVRYYFIGFGDAYHISPTQMPLVVDIGGNDTSAPELHTFQPYDPFKLDIYTLGNVMHNELLAVRRQIYALICIVYRHLIPQKYHGLEFLAELVGYMRAPDFQKRPNSDSILRSWYRIRNGLDEATIEDQPLRFKDGMKPRYTYDSDPPSSVLNRSFKRDISSILNKASSSFKNRVEAH